MVKYGNVKFCLLCNHIAVLTRVPASTTSAPSAPSGAISYDVQARDAWVCRNCADQELFVDRVET